MNEYGMDEGQDYALDLHDCLKREVRRLSTTWRMLEDVIYKLQDSGAYKLLPSRSKAFTSGKQVLQDELREVGHGFAKSLADRLPDEAPPSWLTAKDIMSDPRYAQGLPTITTGLESLDRLLSGGVRCGSVCIIAGRTGSAKSQLAANMVRLAGLSGTTTLFFTLEDELRTAVWRMHAASANTPMTELLDGFADRHGPARTALVAQYSTLHDLPVRISDVRDIQGIERLICEHAEQDGELVVIDQLSKISAPEMPSASTYEKVSAISESLRMTAVKYRLPIIVNVQVNRPAQMRDGDLEIHDLRDSGMLEQDASAVLLINKARDHTRSSSVSQAIKYLPIKLAKNRFGPSGQSIELLWHPRISRIDDQPEVRIRQ